MEQAAVRTTSKAEESTLRYWLTRPVAERGAAVETLRQHYIAQHFDAEPRLRRVCGITRLGQG